MAVRMTALLLTAFMGLVQASAILPPFLPLHTVQVPGGNANHQSSGTSATEAKDELRLPFHHPNDQDASGYISALWNEHLVKPSVTVQGWLAEGMGAQDDTDSAVHVVIAVSGTPIPNSGIPDTDNLFIPYQHRLVQVAASVPVKILYEGGDGSGKYAHLTLGPSGEEILSLRSNAFGRISFSIPVEELFSKKTGAPVFPIIYVKTVDDSQWMGAHIDLDPLHKLTSLTGEQLASIAKGINSKKAESYAGIIRRMAASTQSHAAFSIPSKGDVSRLQSTSRFQKRHSVDPDYSEYDHIKNYLPVFPVNRDEDEDEFDHIHRVLASSNSLSSFTKRDAGVAETAWTLNITQAQNMSTEDHVLLSHADDKVMLVHSVTTGGMEAFLDKGIDGISRFVVSTFDIVWEVIAFICKELMDMSGLKRLLTGVQDLFNWSDILRTNEYLDNYYKILSPLGLRGMDILSTGYREHLADWFVKGGEHMFDKAIHDLGGRDVTLESLEQELKMNAAKATADKMGTNVNATMAALTDPLRSDAQTSMIQDRYLNNLPHSRMDNLDDKFRIRMGDLLEQIANSLVSVVDQDVWNSIKPHVLRFQKGTHLHKKGMAEILNLFRSLAVLSAQVSTRVVDAIIHLMPAYWNLALTLFTFEFEIPFVSSLWRKLTHNTANMSVINALTLMGSTYATASYKFWHNGKAPFTDADIKALKTCQEPELFLYTWNTHSLTASKGDKILETHRLGLYDWIPRAHSAFLSILQKTAYNVPLVFMNGPGKEPNIAEPNDNTKPAQTFNAIANIMGRMGGYPFTQISTSDPTALAKSKASPDSRFLGWWTFWIIEDIVKVVRPMTPFATGIGMTVSNLLIIGVPLTYYGLRVNYDTGKGIKSDDYPRRAVVLSMWIENMSYYFEILLPYSEKTGVYTAMNWAETRAKFIAQMVRDGVFLSIMFARSQLMMACEVVGMLSSSYQAENASMAFQYHTT